MVILNNRKINLLLTTGIDTTHSGKNFNKFYIW
jgi:hypothetical protein